jgi:putative PEP-CTERM system TPR-repeat lipoprotein
MRVVSIALIGFILFVSGCGGSASPEELVEKGQQYFERDEFNSAIIEFKNAIKLAPNTPGPRVLLGKAYAEIGQFASAAKELNRAIQNGADKAELMQPLAYAYLQLDQFSRIVEEIRPEFVEGATARARLHAYVGLALAHLNDDQAITSLEKARSLDAQNAEVRLAWAAYEMRRNEFGAQKKWLEPLLEQGRGNPDAWSQVGRIELKQENLDKALLAFSRSIQQRSYVHPDLLMRAMVYIKKNQLDKAQADIDRLQKAKSQWIGVPHVGGLIALQRNDMTTARELFQKVLSMNPDYAPSQYLLASIEIRENNLQNALSLLEQYVDRIPDNISANLAYSDVLIRLGKLDRAQEQLKRLHASEKDDPRVLVLFGRSFLKQNKIDQAIDYFQRSLEITPEDVGARLLLGQALLSQPKTRKLGIQELEKAIEENPNLVAAYESLFKSYLQNKNFDKAREVAVQVKEKFKDSSRGDNMEALALLQEGKKILAVGLLKNTLKRFPEDPVTSQNLARIYVIDGDLDSAKQAYEGLLLRDPGDMRVLAQLAMIAARQGDKESTVKWLKQAVDKNPDQLGPKLTLAAEYVVRGQPKQADLILAPQEIKFATDPSFLLVMSQTKIALKDFQKAQRLLKTLISDVPESATANMLLAKVYANTGDKENLRASLERVLELRQDHFDAQLALARLELLEGNNEAFKSWMSKLSPAYPNNPDVMWLKAKMDSGSRDYKGAVVTLSNLLGHTPKSGVVKELALSHWKNGDRDDAISVLEVWRKDNPDDINVLSDLAQYYAVEKRDDESREVYTRLNQLTPNNPIVLNNLAWLMRDTELKKALEYAKKSLSIEPDDANTMDTLAVLYFKDRQFENSLLYAKSAFNAKPGEEAIQLTYARSLIANNEVKLGKRILTKLLQDTDSNLIRQQAKTELDQLK